jgi:hypothetical protein
MRRNRQVKRTLLVQTEGREDKAWCFLLKHHFADSDLTSITIDPGSGGSPVEVVRAAITKKRLLHDTYDHVVAIVDGDRPEELDDARLLARRNNIELVVVAPCMEALLLNVLEPESAWYSTDSGHKSHFERNYIRSDRRTQHVHYFKVFSPEVISVAAQSDPTLARLIELMRGQNWL